jgi:hypothetical protein
MGAAVRLSAAGESPVLGDFAVRAAVRGRLVPLHLLFRRLQSSPVPHRKFDSDRLQYCTRVLRCFADYGISRDRRDYCGAVQLSAADVLPLLQYRLHLRRTVLLLLSRGLSRVSSREEYGRGVFALCLRAQLEGAGSHVSSGSAAVRADLPPRAAPLADHRDCRGDHAGIRRGADHRGGVVDSIHRVSATSQLVAIHDGERPLLRAADRYAGLAAARNCAAVERAVSARVGGALADALVRFAVRSVRRAAGGVRGPARSGAALRLLVRLVALRSHCALDVGRASEQPCAAARRGGVRDAAGHQLSRIQGTERGRCARDVGRRARQSGLRAPTSRDRAAAAGGEQAAVPQRPVSGRLVESAVSRSAQLSRCEPRSGAHQAGTVCAQPGLHFRLPRRPVRRA